MVACLPGSGRRTLALVPLAHRGKRVPVYSHCPLPRCPRALTLDLALVLMTNQREAGPDRGVCVCVYLYVCVCVCVSVCVCGGGGMARG